MSLLRARSDGDAHWSKDYIEHLRTVHFLLIVSAVTGIALSRAPSTPQLQIAQHEIRTIIQFVEKQIAGSEQVAEFNGPEDVSDTRVWLVFGYGGKNYFAAEPGMYTIIQGCSKPDNKIDRTERESAEQWRMNFVSLKTLDDFRDMWDSFHCGEVTVFNPEDVSTTLMVRNTYISVRQQVGTGPELIKKRYVYEKFGPSSDVVDSDDTANARNMKFVHLHTMRINSKGNALVLDSMETSEFPRGTFTLLVHSRKLPRSREQKDLIEEEMPEWKCRGQFAGCFYDLYRVGYNRGSYSLKDVSGLVDSEIARNERQFEVFGIKFPTEDLSRWGIAIIIAILVYFCLHLRELSPKITCADSGLDVAWLGLYSSWYSCVVLWVSVLVVPCIAVVLLGLEGAEYQGPLLVAMRTHWWKLCLWVVCPSIASCVLATLSCLAARRLALLAGRARANNILS